MLKIDKEHCTGCGACVQGCAKRCISWISEELGFHYPKIDESMCIDCGLCAKVCPIGKKMALPIAPKAYAAVHKDSKVVAASTSGGAFSAIADVILDRQGIIYGAAMLENTQVKHIRVSRKDDLVALQSSKYVQSDTGNTYQQVERDLKQGRTVLYTGTPCQIDGLKSFLRREYQNLYTVDLVCHGVGSQNYFDKYIDYARKRYGKIKSFRFRSKDFAGWSCGNGAIVTENEEFLTEKKFPFHDFDNYYYAYFLSGDIYRKCCYSCKYASAKRVGDFSLGDYWGVEALNLNLQTENGCSLVLVNNKQAENLLDEVAELDKVETSIEQAIRCNKQLNEPCKMPIHRGQRILEFENMTGNQIQKEYLKTHRITLIKGILKAMLPYKLKLFIRGMRK